jgi:anti-sigma B factor antagonist
MAANPLPTPTLNLTTEKTPAESIVRCTGKITLETAAQLRETAKSLISESKAVALDFTGVSYLDSSGLGMIVGLLISAKKSGCQLRLVNLSPRVKEIFTMTRLSEALAGHEQYFGY